MRTFRGLTFQSELNLWISAFVDSLLYALSSVGFNPRLMLRGLHFYRVKGIGVIAVRGGTDDFYYMIPGREGDVDIFVKSCLNMGSVFVDVGANIGYYTLIASKLVGSQGRVYSIEPVPSTATILKANIKLNNCLNVSIHEVAVWSSKGTLTLRIPGSWYGLAFVSRYGGNIVVNSITLDELLKNETSIDCIKIDVEGAELEVLRGAKDMCLSKLNT
ncbi:FkbM family methyltransferase [Thermosphaera sp.]